MAKIITLTTLYLTCIITLQIHHITESTSMPALLYSLYYKTIVSKFQITILMILHWYVSHKEI